MKSLTYLTFLLIFLSISCSKEKISDITTEIPDGEINTTPCEYSLNNLSPNTVLSIDCTINLQGETVEIPSDVTLIFDQGQIINGKLNFNANGVIDTRLLNISLKITGNVVSDKDELKFMTDKWDIKEGVINDQDATKNKANFQQAIDLSKFLNIKKFNIDEIDAFFKIDVPSINNEIISKEAIHLPSDFQLNMTDNSFLRVQPFDLPWGILISVFKQKNVIITGGNLIGDRFEHTYTPYTDDNGFSRDTHEFPALLSINGSENIVVDGTNLKASTGDCIFIGAVDLRTKPDVLWNKNITVRNCIVDEGRRNNISITDGENILIEKNKIINGGLGNDILDDIGNIIYSSAGVFPKYGLDVEPYFEYDSFTYESLIKYEWVEDVHIRNNDFINNADGSIIVYTGDKVTIDDNFSDHVIALNDTRDTTIKNNTIEARSDIEGYRAGITTGDYLHYTDFEGGNLEQYAINNNVTRNTVNGFSRGIEVFGKSAQIKDNLISDFDIGLVIEGAENIDIFKNNYQSTRPYSTGIFLKGYGNGVKIYDETIKVEEHYLYADGFNKTIPNSTNDLSTYTLEISNCLLNSKNIAFLKNTVGVHLFANTAKAMQIIKSDGIRFENNIVDDELKDGLVLDESVNSRIIDNNFTLTEGYLPIIVLNEPTGANNVISGNN